MGTTAEERAAEWGRVAKRSFSNHLNAALTCARLTPLEEASIISGAIAALAEVMFARERADTLQNRAKQAELMWVTCGSPVFKNLAAGLTPLPRS